MLGTEGFALSHLDGEIRGGDEGPKQLRPFLRVPVFVGDSQRSLFRARLFPCAGALNVGARFL